MTPLKLTYGLLVQIGCCDWYGTSGECDETWLELGDRFRVNIWDTQPDDYSHSDDAFVIWRWIDDEQRPGVFQEPWPKKGEFQHLHELQERIGDLLPTEAMPLFLARVKAAGFESHVN